MIAVIQKRCTKCNRDAELSQLRAEIERLRDKLSERMR